MREPSIYMSEKFVNQIWSEFRDNKLKNNRAKENYFSILCMICDDTKTDFLDLKHSQVKEYFDKLKVQMPGAKRVSHSTLQSRLSVMRSVSSYIVENRDRFSVPESYVNFYYNIDVPAAGEYLKKEDIPTINELERILLASADDPMMHLIFAMVIRCGFAASEICKMKVSQIIEDAAGRFCVVFREKEHIRYVKIPEDVVTALLKYRRFIAPSQEYMFYNKKGYVLKVRNLETLVKKYVKEANIFREYTIQDIRNAAICYMKASGADDMSVANYVGVEGRWMYRYDHVIKELDLQPVDLTKIRIVG